MKVARLLALLVSVAVVLAACGAAQDNAAPLSRGAHSGQVAPPQAPVAKQLDFTAKTVDGQEFSGATLAGKPAVLWFWAPWCPICQGEVPGIARAAHQHPAVTFVGVAALDQVPPMKAFVDNYGIGFFTNIADVNGTVWQRFGVTEQPAFAFVGADGTVAVVRGTVPESDLAARLDALAKT